MQLQDVRDILDPDNADDSSDDERWNRMWDTVFPALQNRPSPCLFTSPNSPRNKQPGLHSFVSKISTCLWWPQTPSLMATSCGFR
jgi:hypothetical protein